MEGEIRAQRHWGGWIPRGMTRWRNSRRGALGKPRREASEDTNPAGTLILDF